MLKSICVHCEITDFDLPDWTVEDREKMRNLSLEGKKKFASSGPRNVIQMEQEIKDHENILNSFILEDAIQKNIDFPNGSIRLVTSG